MTTISGEKSYLFYFLLNMMTNGFYFILKAFFILKIFKLLPLHFGHVEKTA